MSLALLPDRPAVLDLVDVTGRRVSSQALAGGGLGPREVPLGGGGITPGVYWVRLRQAGLAFTRKAVVIR